jgi:DNA-directed RNA polymerase specialized sigma subunit
LTNDPSSEDSPSPINTPSIEEANALAVEHTGWAESIARSVARAWGLDWQDDGLDGAAMEALLFCARRFDHTRGVPFRGYARRRIHEAASEQARRSKGWRRSTDNTNSIDDRAREISHELLGIFPELRAGQFGDNLDSGEIFNRASIREMLMGAALLATKHDVEELSMEDAVDVRRLVRGIVVLEPVHQAIVWKVYWEGTSLRGLADEWDIDGLNIIREHKMILEHLCRMMQAGKQPLTRPKIRPGLRTLAEGIKRNGFISPFSSLLPSGTSP